MLKVSQVGIVHKRLNWLVNVQHSTCSLTREWSDTTPSVSLVTICEFDLGIIIDKGLLP